jgi:hypothetical protein
VHIPQQQPKLKIKIKILALCCLPEHVKIDLAPERQRTPKAHARDAEK